MNAASCVAMTSYVMLASSFFLATTLVSAFPSLHRFSTDDGSRLEDYPVEGGSQPANERSRMYHMYQSLQDIENRLREYRRQADTAGTYESYLLGTQGKDTKSNTDEFPGVSKRRSSDVMSVLPPWQEFCRMLGMMDCGRRFKRSLAIEMKTTGHKHVTN